ncbi:MAG: glycogen synthase GlgA [Alphaproteobacteria bacterium]
MRVLFAAAEAYPLIKTGGLADVAGALPVALSSIGEDVRVLLPAYPQALELVEGRGGAITLGNLMGVGSVSLIPGRMPDSGLAVWMVECPSLYGRTGNPYVGPDGADWPDNHLRFALLSQVAALIGVNGEVQEHLGGWRPDVLHANDWQTGLVPAYVKLWGARRPATVFTVHNLAYQGRFGREILHAIELPEACYSVEGVEFYGSVSYLKAGLYYADRITTVSPTYAHEIQTEAEGQGLQGLLRARSGDLVGILNGEDPKLWDPATDPAIQHHYSRTSLEGKAADKADLQREMGLEPNPNAPLCGMISRLTEQKGIDLVLAAVPDIVVRGGQVFLLGTGDAALENACQEMMKRYPGRVSVVIGFDESLAHRVQAGCDVLMMPSRFEPCGLSQLYALRYGTIPVVRHTGGLADTVIDMAQGNVGTGFVFRQATVGDFCGAMHRALALYRMRPIWQQLQRRAMAQDFSWRRAAEEYQRLYRGLN